MKLSYNIRFEDAENYDLRYGGPWDRGAADSHYGRGPLPHYFLGGTYSSPEVRAAQMTPAEIDAYLAGYAWNDLYGPTKEY